jgi:hypothetical protein
MLAKYTFTDKNRDFSTHQTINDTDCNYSTFSQDKWSIVNHTDIVELKNI